MKHRILSIIILICAIFTANAQYKREIYVNQDGTGDCTTLAQAFELIKAYMEYDVTVHIAPGTYKEKVVVPSWIRNVTFEGENPETTIITFDHHANIDKMGTFRTYTVRVDGDNLTFKNLTIENNAPRKGQAVALHTEGDCLTFINCRLLGNQDTLFTGGMHTRLFFDHCYIEGTTDFIFGPATAYFKDCTIHSKQNSYVTAASTPEDVAVGYVFDNCKLTANPDVDKVFLGRPWRPFAHTVFINCELGKHIAPAGWHNWGDPEREKTSRYGEYGSTGPGASPSTRVTWAKALTPDEVKDLLNLDKIFSFSSAWNPVKK